MSRKLWHFAGSNRRCLLMAGKDGEMFMTISFNVTPKTTEQHLFVGRFVLLMLTTDRHEASRGLFVTAELLVHLTEMTVRYHKTLLRYDAIVGI